MRPAAIIGFRDLGAWFKFVVASAADVEEVLAIRAAYALSSERIVLMPLGMRREDGFRFSPRLHILLWGPNAAFSGARPAGVLLGGSLAST